MTTFSAARTVMAAVALLATVTSACMLPAPVLVDGVSVSPPRWEHAQRSVMSTAAFDMKCPAADIKLTPIDVGKGPFDFQIGATGCGQSARYVDVSGVGWVANTGTK